MNNQKRIRRELVANFAVSNVKVLGAKRFASFVTSGTPQPAQAAHLPVPRYMLSEQAYIAEFGYSH